MLVLYQPDTAHAVNVVRECTAPLSKHYIGRRTSCRRLKIRFMLAKRMRMSCLGNELADAATSIAVPLGNRVRAYSKVRG